MHIITHFTQKKIFITESFQHLQKERDYVNLHVPIAQLQELKTKTNLLSSVGVHPSFGYSHSCNGHPVVGSIWVQGWGLSLAKEMNENCASPVFVCAYLSIQTHGMYRSPRVCPAVCTILHSQGAGYKFCLFPLKGIS